MSTATITREKAVLTRSIVASCEYCVHAQVCSILRAISPLLNSFDKVPGLEKTLKKPINPLDLAKICNQYTPFLPVK